MSKSEEQEFDKFADDYGKILSKSLKKWSGFGREYFSQYKVQQVKEILKSEPEKILDFGCGDGQSCEFFRRYFPKTALVGVDISPESIKIAQDKEISNVSFICVPGEELPFEEESFDLIFASGVFHHIEKEKHFSTVVELKKKLKKGGKIFIFEHNPINPFTQKIVKDCVFDKGAELIFAKSFKKMINLAKFKGTKINYTLFFPRHKIFQPLFFLEKYFVKIPIGAQYFIEAEK